MDWLLQDGTLDLTRTVAVVATAQAGRRLREALAVRAAQTGRAIFPPIVVEPEGLLRLLAGEANASAAPATRLEAMVAWAQVLLAANLEEFRAVFPVDPPKSNFAWAVRVGQQFLEVQMELAERGLRCGDLARQAGAAEDFPERERWGQVAELESRVDARLAENRRIDAQLAKIRAAQRPTAPANIDRIAVLGLPDPLPLAIEALSTLERSSPRLAVVVAVAAPEAERENFDAWGRPVADGWSRRPIPWVNFSEQIRLLADPRAQAQAIADLAHGYGENRAAFAVGCPDAEIIAPLEQALAEVKIPSFDPDGRRRRSEGFYHLMGCLADLVGEGSFEAVEATGRCTDILAFLRRRVGPSQFSAAGWLAGLDALRARHLPPDLDSARRHAPGLAGRYPSLVPGLAALAEVRATARDAGFAAGVAGLLDEIFRHRRIDPNSPEDRVLADAAAAWMAVVRACGEEERGTRFLPEDWWDLALRLFGESRRTQDRPAGAVVLQGWMEMLWESAPHLVIAGFNDGAIPSAIRRDAFLPEALRLRLGLKTNRDRLARDAYLLRACAECRRAVGRLDLLVGRASAQGDPLHPSRLLLLCADQELPGRVRELFRELPPTGAPRPWTRAWQLDPLPPATDFRQRLSVTAFKSWLDCPFRFYLRHGLDLEEIDATKSEMDAPDFGTLCHAALQSMGEEARLRECSDPEILQDFLLGRLDARVREIFGAELSLPLIVQVESARQRLRRLAQIQAQQVWSGWRIEAVEQKFTFVIAGITIVAKIDRIDRHAQTGAVRVLDYKTSDQPVIPVDAHLRKPGKNEMPAPFMLWEGNGEPKVWKDLQLPLYRHALTARYPELSGCGYINLPKAVSSSALELWEPFSRDLQASAVACADAVCRAIRAGEFWPPVETPKAGRDPYASLFHHGVAESVRWKGVP